MLGSIMSTLGMTREGRRVLLTRESLEPSVILCQEQIQLLLVVMQAVSGLLVILTVHFGVVLIERLVSQ